MSLSMLSEANWSPVVAQPMIFSGRNHSDCHSQASKGSESRDSGIGHGRGATLLRPQGRYQDITVSESSGSRSEWVRMNGNTLDLQRLKVISLLWLRHLALLIDLCIRLLQLRKHISTLILGTQI